MREDREVAPPRNGLTTKRAPRQRCEQAFEGLSDIQVRSGQGKQAHAQEQEYQPRGYERGMDEPCLADAEDAPLEVDLTSLDEQHVQQCCDDDDEQQR